MKYQECNKIVKQKAFERAIASDEIKKSVVDSLDIENMSKCIFFFEEKKWYTFNPETHLNDLLQQPLRTTTGAPNLKMARLHWRS